jgi:hypothetical protein
MLALLRRIQECDLIFVSVYIIDSKFLSGTEYRFARWVVANITGVRYYFHKNSFKAPQ